MIQVFCARRGSGKTKRLIELANHQQLDAKGDAVYIDDDSRPMLQLSRGIRFVDTNEYNVEDCQSFYGMFNIVKCTMKESTDLFRRIAGLTDRFGINIYINVNVDTSEEVPECIREYVA